MFLKKSNTLTTTPNPIDPLTLTLDLAPSNFFIFFSHSPGFELQTSNFEVHLHLHYATQAIVANLLNPYLLL